MQKYKCSEASEIAEAIRRKVLDKLTESPETAWKKERTEAEKDMGKINQPY